jgi:hypothetical protein
VSVGCRGRDERWPVVAPRCAGLGDEGPRLDDKRVYAPQHADTGTRLTRVLQAAARDPSN